MTPIIEYFRGKKRTSNVLFSIDRMDNCDSVEISALNRRRD
jgi:hypothetical protein